MILMKCDIHEEERLCHRSGRNRDCGCVYIQEEKEHYLFISSFKRTLEGRRLLHSHINSSLVSSFSKSQSQLGMVLPAGYILNAWTKNNTEEKREEITGDKKDGGLPADSSMDPYPSCSRVEENSFSGCNVIYIVITQAQ